MINPLQKQILAILFAGGDAVEISRVAQAVETEPEMVVKWVPMPFELLELDGKLQLCTAPEYAPVIQKALELRRNQPLSQAALEVLAIVAYNQPVTRSFVEQIRGVDSSGVVTSLEEKGLVEDAGRLELPGRPIAYKPTAHFLRCFGLDNNGQLPKLPPAKNTAEETSLETTDLEEPT